MKKIVILFLCLIISLPLWAGDTGSGGGSNRDRFLLSEITQNHDKFDSEFVRGQIKTLLKAQKEIVRRNEQAVLEGEDPTKVGDLVALSIKDIKYYYLKTHDENEEGPKVPELEAVETKDGSIVEVANIMWVLDDTEISAEE